MTDTTAIPSPRNEVHNAALYLDEHGPVGWRGEIDIDRLAMMSPYQCVLGQIYPDRGTDGWTAGLGILFGGRLGNDDEADLRNYGFTVNVFASWRDAWVEELTA